MAPASAYAETIPATVERPACLHVWIDPQEPLASRRPVLPIIGTLLPEMMKRGRTYKCENCKAIFVVPAR